MRAMAQGYVCHCYCEIDDDSVKVEAKDSVEAERLALEKFLGNLDKDEKGCPRIPCDCECFSEEELEEIEDPSWYEY